MKAENKWDKEEDYIFLKKWIECNLKTDENLGIDKAIYEKLPKVIMQENKSELIDLSFINLSNLSFGKVWMGHYLSHANLSGSKFLRTHFHHAVAVDTDFSGSFFERAQFIPFFSPNSNFENCVFKDCLAFGSGGNPKDNYSYNNFDNCNFKNIKIVLLSVLSDSVLLLIIFQAEIVFSFRSPSVSYAVCICQQILGRSSPPGCGSNA